MGHIRSAQPVDMARLLEIWLSSVRATHHFLTEADIESLLPIVRDIALPSLELWILCERDDVPVGFIGLDGSSLEALFIDPSRLRRGGGRRLTEHARQLKGPLSVSVNEQNPEALEFYIACGFEVIGRSPVDDGGRPFPLLHMRDALEPCRFTSALICANLHPSEAHRRCDSRRVEAGRSITCVLPNSSTYDRPELWPKTLRSFDDRRSQETEDP